MSRSITKPTKSTGHPMKTQISLGIRPVWSESSLSAWRNIGSLATHWAHSEDPDQTGRMRLIWVFVGRIGHFVGFVMHWLECYILMCCFSTSENAFSGIIYSLLCYIFFPLFSTKFVVKCATKSLKIVWQTQKLCPKYSWIWNFL